MSRLLRVSLIFTVAGLMHLASLSAADVSWTNTGTTGDFSDPANWDSNPNLPLDTDTLYIQNGGTANITSGATVATAANLYLGQGLGYIGALSQSDGYLTITGELLVGDSRGTGTLSMSGGTINTAILDFGRWSGTIGTLTMTGGTINTTDWVAFGDSWDGTNGYAVGNGTLTGTASLNSNSSLTIGGSTYGVGTLTLGTAGGTDAPSVASGSVNIGNGGTGTLTLNANSTVTTGNTTIANGVAGTSGTLELNGGIYATTAIAGGTSGGTPTVRFNGGVLKALGSDPTGSKFISGTSMQFDVQAGGAIIDTNSCAITSAVGFNSSGVDGGLTVKGYGSLQLNASSAYTGTTTIDVGTTLTANSGVALATTGVSAAYGSTLNLNCGAQLTGVMGSASIDTANLRIALTPDASAPIFNVTKSGSGDVALTGITNLYLPADGREFSTSPYTLFRYNTISGGPGNLNVIPDPTVRSLTATPYTDGNAIKLNISYDRKSLVWNPDGDTSSYWMLSDDAKQWKEPAAQNFYNLDDVSFTDAGIAFPAVILYGTLHPRSILVNNSTGNNYYFQDGGAAKITGFGTTLTKDGDGMLAISNTGGNDFTGDVTVNAGTLEINASNQLGTSNTIYVKNASALNATAALDMAKGSSQNLNISGTAVVTTTAKTTFGNSGGYAEVTMTGGEFKPGPAATEFGNAGKAKLTMSGNAKITLNTGNYAFQFGANVSDPANISTIVMNDDAKIAGISFPASNTNNAFRLGYNGYGTLVMNDRSILDVNRLYMATSTTSSRASYAKIEVNEEATIITHSTSQVGFEGTGHGEIIISGSPRVAFNSGGRLDVGITGSGAYGLFEVNGTGVKVTGTQLRVGGYGPNTGFFTLNAGTEATFNAHTRLGENGGLDGISTLTVNDAILNTTGTFNLGYRCYDYNAPLARGVNTLEINGTSVVSCTKTTSTGALAWYSLGIGANYGEGIITINSGSLTAPDIVVIGQGNTVAPPTGFTTGAPGKGTLNLNGGVMQVQGFLTDANAHATAVAGTEGIVNFNGGTLKANADNLAFFTVDDATLGSLTLNVKKNATTGLGAVIDSGTFNIGFAFPLQHDPTEGAPAIDGGLKKLGAGTLTLTGGIGYTGPTTIDAGLLAINNGLANTLSTVSGAGSLSVLGTTSLTATSIEVDTLTIGGAGFAAVPEPGTFVLLALAAVGALLAWRRK